MPLPISFAVAILSGLFFLGLHRLCHRTSDRGFGLDAMMARGIAGGLLALIGFGSLAFWWGEWKQAFLAPRGADSSASLLVWFVIGHLVADMGWFLWGRQAEGEPLRTDLMLHHLLGLAASVAALWIGAGQIAIGVVLSTELLPLTTGIRGLAKARSDPDLERLALRAGLGVVVFWRIPLFLFLTTVLGWRLATGRPFGLVHVCALVGLAAVLILDVGWARGFRRSLARQERTVSDSRPAPPAQDRAPDEHPHRPRGLR